MMSVVEGLVLVQGFELFELLLLLVLQGFELGRTVQASSSLSGKQL